MYTLFRVNLDGYKTQHCTSHCIVSGQQKAINDALMAEPSTKRRRVAGDNASGDDGKCNNGRQFVRWLWHGRDVTVNLWILLNGNEAELKRFAAWHAQRSDNDDQDVLELDNPASEDNVAFVQEYGACGQEWQQDMADGVLRLPKDLDSLTEHELCVGMILKEYFYETIDKANETIDKANSPKPLSVLDQMLAEALASS